MKVGKINSKNVLHDIMVTILLLAVTFLVCTVDVLRESSVAPTLIFIVAVALTARLTSHYIYGAIASLISVFCVNYAFTRPFFTFYFALSDLLPSLITMLAISGIISALTTQSKERAKLESDIEKEKNTANLLRSISHDVRTPLTSIIGASSAFLESGERLSEQDQHMLISDIRSEADRLIKMMENILSVTKINSSGAEIEKTLEIAEEILAQAAGKFKKQHPDIQLLVAVPDHVIFIPMDATLIEQVILNILENSVTHGKSSVIQIRVKNETKKIRVEIEDNGVGIQQKILPHLFDGTLLPNREANQDKKRNMGIGLSVCMTIIKAHHGDLIAHNKKNGGAVFEFTLPYFT